VTRRSTGSWPVVGFPCSDRLVPFEAGANQHQAPPLSDCLVWGASEGGGQDPRYLPSGRM
jgi:hypothetical protein